LEEKRLKKRYEKIINLFRHLKPRPITFSKESSDFLRAKFIRSASFSLMVFIVIYILYNIITGEYLFSVFQSISLLVLYIINYSLETPVSLKKATILFLVTLYAMMVISILWGDNQYYSLIWMTISPIVSFYLAGSKKGMKVSVFFLVTLFFFLVLNPREGLSLDSAVHIMYALIILVSIMYYYEKSREASQNFLEEKQKQLYKTSTTDLLTQINNRVYIDQTIEEKLVEINKSKAEDTKWSLVILDIDHFKAVNDTFGHQQGDEVLKTIAGILTQKLVNSGEIARWGGEEFLVSLFDLDLDQAVEVAESLRGIIEQIPFINGSKVTISLGIAEYHEGDTYDTFLKRADDCLYYAKKRGRNQVITERQI
jgi:diguanylate cyclase (GGDEF)-like protein